MSYRAIAAAVGVPKSTCYGIDKHAVANAKARRDEEVGGVEGGFAGLGLAEEISLEELVKEECLAPKKRSGRPRKKRDEELMPNSAASR